MTAGRAAVIRRLVEGDRRRADRGGDRASVRVRAAYCALGVLLLAYVVSEIARRAGQSWPLIDGWGVAGFEIVASGLCIMRGITRRRDRAAALTLGMALLSWSIGDLVLTIESIGGATPPTPSLADVFYLAFYPLTYAALMLVIRRHMRRFTTASWLDGAVAGLGAAAVCAAFAFRDVLHTAGGSAASVATNLAYPVGDMLLLAMVVGGSAVLPGRRKAPWVMLAAGTCLNAVGDTFNLFQSGIGATHVGTLFNGVAWPTSILLISFSVWLRPGRPVRLSSERPPGFLLPGLASGSALAILFVGSIHQSSRVALALAAAALVTAGIRSALSFRSLRALTEERHRQAVTDQLTGLANRRALFDLLDEFLPNEAEAGAESRRLSFLFVDLNRFKEVNDSYGHSAGDELLRQLGARLRGSLRSGDLLVRLGGDEFAVVLVDADADYAATVAQRLAGRIAEPFVLDAVRTQISASIGIAVVPTDAQAAPDLVRCADLAMYRAKLAGMCFAIYHEDLDGVGNRLRLLEELREALEQRRFELHYQPQIDLSSGEVVAVEALLRWPNPRRGYVPPLEFLPLAEEAELMAPLTELALDKALAQCASWRAAGNHVTVAVNISASNLVEPAFAQRVESLLARHQVPACALVLEVTETTAIADFDRSKRAIEQLRDLGVTVSVDDFGAGFTSLAYLSSLAVGELKLDRSFISGITTTDGERDLTLIRSTIDLAHALGLRVVAEGIEDEASLELLASLGCDLAQGYVISRPKPPAELEFSTGPSLSLDVV